MNAKKTPARIAIEVAQPLIEQRDQLNETIRVLLAIAQGPEAVEALKREAASGHQFSGSGWRGEMGEVCTVCRWWESLHEATEDAA